MSMDPMKVIYTRARTLIRAFLNTCTIRLALTKKNLMFRRAHTVASTQNRQVRVLKSKYPAYSLSMGTIREVITAAAKATIITTFFFMNERIPSGKGRCRVLT